MKRLILEKILAHTESGYDRMAEKFSGTRAFFWRDLEFIKDRITSGDKVLDFGCGNGRLLEILKDKKIDYYGVDVSQKLIDLAKTKYPEFAPNISKTSGQVGLDFPENSFDAVVSIAVFHHFPDRNFRLDTARELYRTTKPNGKIIITAWNLWQKKYRRYIWKNMALKIIGRSHLDFFDCEIPFKNNSGEIFTRFHHAYTPQELEKLFSRAGFKEIVVKTINNKNMVLTGKK